MKHAKAVEPRFTKEEKILYAKYFSLLVVMLIVVFYAVSFAMSSKNYNSNKFASDILDSDFIYHGVYVGEVYVGGLTKAQAEDTVQSEYVGYRFDANIFTYVTDYGFEKVFGSDELGAEYDVKKAVSDCYDVARSGSREERLSQLDEIESRGEYTTIDYKVNEGKLKSTLQSLCDEVNKEYEINGEEVDFDSMYDTSLKYLETQQRDMIITIPKKADK